MLRLNVLLLFALMAIGSFPSAYAQDPPAAENAEPQAEQPIDFEYARGLLQKRRAGGTLTAEEAAYLERAMAARRAGQQPGGQQPGVRRPGTQEPRATTGLVPLSAMSADDRYKEEDGGLYGGGSNRPGEELQKAADAALAKIVPRNAAGEPAEDGKVVFVSISMSNATQEFSHFKRLADADSAKSPRVTIVDCAQGGQAMAEWADPQARAWEIAQQRIKAAGCTAEQVQAAWVKIANKAPSGSLAEHGRKLQRDTLEVVRLAREKFPNLQVVYLSSRTYGGYASGNLNPEPYAYESGIVARWLIQEQFAAENKDLPVMVWGAYLWADGEKPRAGDELTWLRDDFGGDGVHPSTSGREKVAQLLLNFLKEDPLASGWFTEKK